jgi:protein-S-isoprenylcysteine O-methyltransferase Ste14
MADSVQAHTEKVMGPALTFYRKVIDYLAHDCIGGPRVKLCHAVNLQKGGTAIFVYALMHYYDNHSTTAYAYLALHGSYGLVWLLKELACPDPSWQTKVTVPSLVVAWLSILGPYWIAPYLLITERVEQPPQVICACSIAYVLGVTLMLGADAQKYFVLKAKAGLITDGFFAKIRHPNYVGEMVLYGSFATLANHAAPWIVLSYVWTLFFLPNMWKKEARMSRHAGWKHYTMKAGFLFPKLF